VLKEEDKIMKCKNSLNDSTPVNIPISFQISSFVALKLKYAIVYTLFKKKVYCQNIFY